MQPTSQTETLAVEAAAFACGTAAPVLQTEDAAAFVRMVEGIRRDVEPRGLVEDMYVGDIACIIWEMLCLRRYRAALINGEFRAAVAAVAQEMMERSGDATAAHGRRVADLARRWFSDADAREEVRTLLRRFNLDETAIEARAIWRAGPRIADLEMRQAALENRRDKALAGIARFRADFSRQMRMSLDRILGPTADDVRRELVESAINDIRRLYQAGEFALLSSPVSPGQEM
jgi:hypothetical protein